MEKTAHLKLNKDARTDAYSVDRVNSNSDIIDKFALDTDTALADIKKQIGNIDLTDTKITCTAKDNKKLDVVLKEINTNIDNTSRKIDNIDLKDTKITCTAKNNKKLDVVLSEIENKITNIGDITISSESKTLSKILETVARKGEILPQDVKGNSDQRLYKYVVLNDAAKDNPYWWIEYVDKNGESKSIRYYLKDLKLIKDIKADIETNKSKISVLESENASLKSEVLELKKQLANNNEQFKKLNEILKSLVGGDH